MNIDKWRQSFEVITPTEAQNILEGNDGNRPTRKMQIAKYAATMAAGNWMPSPDGIIISIGGRLLQGQHRLMAVVQSGVSVTMVVWRNVDDSVFKYLDRGITRTPSDALGISKGLSSVANSGYRIVNGARKIPTDDDIERYALVLSDSYSDLVDHCSTSTKVFSSAASRAACCIRITSGYDREYVLNTYRNLVLGHIGNLPPIGQSFASSVFSGRVKTYGGIQQSDIFARMWDVTDKRKADQSRVQIRDVTGRVKEASEIMRAALH